MIVVEPTPVMVRCSHSGGTTSTFGTPAKESPHRTASVASSGESSKVRWKVA